MKNTQRRLIDIPTVKVHDVEKRAKDALKFIATNANSILLSNMQVGYIKTLRSHASSPIYEMYSRIVTDQATMNQYMFLNLKNVQESVPAILVYPQLSVNAKELDIDVPEVYNKNWINVTPVIGKMVDRDTLVVSDIPELQSLVVRSYLSMTYYQNETWLNPNLVSFVIESYSMAIAKLVQQNYNLNPNEFVVVQILAAYYYACLLSPDRLNQGDLEYPPILNRCGFLGGINDILTVLHKAVPEDMDEPNSMTDLGIIIKNCGIDRLSKIDGAHLYTAFAKNGADAAVMLIAADYPPYWVYQLMRMSSGYKNFMMSSLLKMPSLKRNYDRFIDTLKTTNLNTGR